MKPIHPLQAKLLEALRDVSDEGYTYRSLRDAIGASSTSQVIHHIDQLSKRGLIKKDPDNPANFVIIEEAEQEFSFLPLLALASCGSGNDNDQQVIERIPVRSHLIPTKIEDSFLVRAAGDSMEPRIHNQDIVLVEKYIEGRHNPVNKIVVCEENYQAKIKQYIRSEDQDVLVSFNTKYPPHIVKNANSFRIVGLVRGILFSKIRNNE